MRKSREYWLEKFKNLTYKKKVEVLFSALDFMQQYNGRNDGDCIVLAMEEIYTNN